MGFWFDHRYPDSNLHELDLGWVIDETKKAVAEVASLSKEYANISTDLASLRKYVMDYFAKLDISEEVNKKIDELYDAGLLDDIIDATFKKFNFYEVADMYPFAQTFDRINPTPTQLNAQGMCIAIIDEVPVICTTLVSNDDSVCQVYLNNLSSGEEIFKIQDDRFGHANGVTYFNRKFYFTTPKGGEKKIATLDYDTHTIDIIDINVEGLDTLHGMDYDESTNTFVCRGNYNNAKRIFIMNTSLTEVLSYSHEITYNYNGRYEQSIKCDNDFIYMIDGRSTRDNKGCVGKITVYDRNYNVVSSVITPSMYELEDIDFYNGECYFYVLSYNVGCVMIGSLNPSQNMYGTHASVYEYNEINRYAYSQDIYIGWTSCKFKCDGTVNYPFFAPLFSLVVISKNFHHVRFMITEDIGADDNPVDFAISMNAINIKRVDIQLNGHILTGEIFGSVQLMRILNGTIRYVPASQYRQYAIESEGQLEVLQIHFTNCGNITPIHCLDSIILNDYTSDTTGAYDVDGNFKTTLRYHGTNKLQCHGVSHILCDYDTNLNATTDYSNSSYTRKVLPNGTDLNDIWLSGNYYLNGDFSFLNMPSGVSGLRELDVMQSNTLVRQTITSRGATENGYKQYTRDIILDGYPARNHNVIVGTWHRIVDESV